MNKITIVDAIMGKGKTSWAIQYMNEIFGESARKVIYVTPFIDEIKRVKQSTNRKLKEPDEKKGKGRKLTHFKKLLEDGENIITTHALFGMVDEDIEMLIKNNNYILILDEVFKVIDEINLGKDDIKILKENYITIDDNGKVTWIQEGLYDGRYKDIRDLALNETLYTYGDGSFYYWCFPSRIFKFFYKCYILTYQFKYQIQRYYYDLFNIEYEYKSVTKSNDKYILTDYTEDYDYINQLKLLINVYDGKMNTNYFTRANKYHTELSSNWFKQASEIQTKQLQKNLKNYFFNINRCKSSEILWSCYKSQISKLKGKGYSKSWLEFNSRATNEYKERNTLAYVCNLYMNPFEAKFFSSYDVAVDQDGLALSTLLQWIFRSAIREGNNINIYLPSERMRNLLIQYLEGEM